MNPACLHSFPTSIAWSHRERVRLSASEPSQAMPADQFQRVRRLAQARCADDHRADHGIVSGILRRLLMYFQCFLSQRFGPLSVQPNVRSVGVQKIRTCM